MWLCVCKTHIVASWQRSRWSRWILGWTAFSVEVAKSNLSSMVRALSQWLPWWLSTQISARWRTSRSTGGSTPPQAKALILAVDHRSWTGWTGPSTSNSTSVLVGPFWPRNSISFLWPRNNCSTTGVSTAGTSTTTSSSSVASDKAAVATTEKGLCNRPNGWGVKFHGDMERIERSSTTSRVTETSAGEEAVKDFVCLVGLVVVVMWLVVVLMKDLWLKWLHLIYHRLRNAPGRISQQWLSGNFCWFISQWISCWLNWIELHWPLYYDITITSSTDTPVQ